MNDVQANVLSRYSEAAKEKSTDLCCPIDYDHDLLKLLPTEIIEKDYGCGDTSRYVQPDETVLDLGSGAGKVVYMAAQLAGSAGKIIGIDMNDDMLELARKYQQEMTDKLGYDIVDFRKGYIENLAVDLDAIQQYLSDNPIHNLADHQRLQRWQQSQTTNDPLIDNDTIDLVISNCVLNLVSDVQKPTMMEEIFRVVKPGGRIALADIVSDEIIPQSMKSDSKLWSGCISGAFQEKEFLDQVCQAGFSGVCYDLWSDEPWKVIGGIEFRSVTLTAFKPDPQQALDRGHTLIYRGPYAQIQDDHGNYYPRGERIAVSDQQYDELTKNPAFRKDFIGVGPGETRQSSEWALPPGSKRLANESKTTRPAESGCCAPKSCC